MSLDSQRGEKQKVLIAGAGIAGIEAALALRDFAGERVEVDLCDPCREFVFRPFAVSGPYGAATIFRYDLGRLCARCDASLHAAGVVSVDPRRRLAVTRDGARLPYDYLIIATGARLLRAVPGAATFWGVVDEGQVGEVIEGLRAGSLRRVAFTMPRGPSWALPLYELALLAAAELAKVRDRGARIVIVTPEVAPLECFGRRAAEQVGELLEERGVEVITGANPVKFDGGRLRIAQGEGVAADAVISLPRLEGNQIAGIPHDRDGFVDVDERGGAPGMARVFAAGDVTTFPFKQGGIATQQADAATEAIAHDAGAELAPRPFDPILHGVLWSGREPRYLHRGPGGDGVEASSLSERPQASMQNGKVAGRYLAPFFDSLSGGRDPTTAAGRRYRP